MKHLKAILTSLLIFSLAFVSGQSNNAKEKESTKVEIYTAEERDNLQIWFHEKIKDMHLSEETGSAYFNILVDYGYKFGRLDDKDKGLSKEAVQDNFDALLLKQNKEVKRVLTKEQYGMHEKSYEGIVYSIKMKLKKL